MITLFTLWGRALLLLVALTSSVWAEETDVYLDACVVQANDASDFHSVADYLSQSDFYFGEIVGSLYDDDFDSTSLMAIGLLVISDVWGERVAILERQDYPSRTAAVLERAQQGARWIAIRRGCVPRVIRPASLDGQEILQLSLERFGAPAPIRMFEWR